MNSSIRETKRGWLIYGNGDWSEVVFTGGYFESWYVEMRDANAGTWSCFSVYVEQESIKIHTETL